MAKYPDQVNIHGHKFEIFKVLLFAKSLKLEFKVDRPKNIPYLILEVLGMP